MVRFNYEMVVCNPEDARKVDFILTAALCKVMNNEIKFDYSGKPGKPDAGRIFNLSEFDKLETISSLSNTVALKYFKEYLSDDQFQKWHRRFLTVHIESVLLDKEIFETMLKCEKIEEVYDFFYLVLTTQLKDAEFDIKKKGGRDVALTILENATKPVVFKPFKNAAKYSNNIYVVDNIKRFGYEDSSYYDDENHCFVGVYSGFYFEPMGTLDFWNEIEGWFEANSKTHKVKVSKTADDMGVDIPVPCELVTDDEIKGLIYPVGDWFVDSDYNLYRCYGVVEKSHGNPIKIDEMYHSEI